MVKGKRGNGRGNNEITKFKESRKLENKLIKLIKKGKVTEDDLGVIRRIFDDNKKETHENSRELRRKAIDEAKLRAQMDEVPLETRKILLESAFKGEKVIKAARELKKEQKRITEKIKKTPKEERENALREELNKIKKAKRNSKEEEDYLAYAELEKIVKNALKTARKIRKESTRVEKPPEVKEAEKVRKKYFGQTVGYLDKDERARRTMGSIRRLTAEREEITPEIAEVIKKEAGEAKIGKDLLLSIMKEKRNLTEKEKELLK